MADASLLSWAQANAKNLPQSIAETQKAISSGVSRTGQKLTAAQLSSLKDQLSFQQNAMSLLSPSKPVAVAPTPSVPSDALMTKPAQPSGPLVPLQEPLPVAPKPAAAAPTAPRFVPSSSPANGPVNPSAGAWDAWMASNRAAEQAAAERATAEKIARTEGRAITTAAALQANATLEAAKISAASAGTRLPQAATTALDLGKNATTEDVMRRRVRRGISSTISDKRMSNPLTQAPTLLGN